MNHCTVPLVCIVSSFIYLFCLVYYLSERRGYIVAARACNLWLPDNLPFSLNVSEMVGDVNHSSLLGDNNFSLDFKLDTANFMIKNAFYYVLSHLLYRLMNLTLLSHYLDTSVFK